MTRSPGISKTPFVHPESKPRLARLCLRSFARALQGVRARVIVLLDGCPDGYEGMVREELDGNICRCTGYHNIVKAILAAA